MGPGRQLERARSNNEERDEWTYHVRFVGRQGMVQPPETTPRNIDCINTMA
jgi:hypothetical protein